jgi:hypothetical protein
MLAAATFVATSAALAMSTPASAASVGYVRLAHFSPDTPPVDVYLSSVSGAVPEKVFRAVGYGALSSYLTLPTGTYGVAMRLAGHTGDAVVSTAVTVTAGGAYTVAGVGTKADLGLRVLTDDLKLPDPGKAKVRIVQASVLAPSLSVSQVGGGAIADGVTFATTTPYQQVSPGAWALKIQATGATSSTTVNCTLVEGDVYSLLVLDGKNNATTAKLVTDAKRSGGGMPVGGVETGAGGSRGFHPLPVVAGLILVALFGAAVVTQVRQRT